MYRVGLDTVRSSNFCAVCRGCVFYNKLTATVVYFVFGQLLIRLESILSIYNAFVRLFDTDRLVRVNLFFCFVPKQKLCIKFVPLKVADVHIASQFPKFLFLVIISCIGFDAGGSDRKVSAVIDGKTVYSEEVVWHPKTEPDPQYHFDGIVEAFRTAASKMPRVDGIGVSSAGVFIGNSPMVSALFLKVPREKRELVKTIYDRAAREIGDVPIVVANDGDVTALAGAMGLECGSVMGMAMGTSEAVGYVDAEGKVLQTVTNNDKGNVSFDVKYNKAGTYTYTISEVEPEGAVDHVKDHITYDRTVYNVTVKVTNGTDQLDALVTYNDGSQNPPTFTNKYSTTLPEAGGAGLTMTYLAGASLLCFAATWMHARRHRGLDRDGRRE